MHQRQLITIFISCLILAGLGPLYLKQPHSSERVDAVGKVSFTFNGLPPNAPVFNAPDVKPGDCYVRLVTAKNEGLTNAQIGVKAININNPNHFDRVLITEIAANNQTVYGGSLGLKTIKTFFADTSSRPIPLAIIQPQGSRTFQFSVCLPSTTGNEYQQASLVYDLSFSTDPYTCPTNLHLVQSNQISITNSITTSTATGSNQTTQGTGTLHTGSAGSNVSITNTVGSNILNADIQACCPLALPK